MTKSHAPILEMDMIKSVFDFLSNNKISLSKRVLIPLLFIGALFIYDNIVGFSYFYFHAKKLDYIINIETAKIKYAHDKVLTNGLTQMMDEALYRENIFQQFVGLFQNKEAIYVNDAITSPKKEVPHSFLPIMKERNIIWHTVSSSFIFVVALFVMIIYSIILPFLKENDKKDIIAGLIFIIPMMFAFIWFLQWLFGLIPVLWERAYINYTLQFALNITICIIAAKFNKNSKKN